MKKEITVLISIILLIYKESLSKNDITSKDTILEVIDIIKNSKRGYDDNNEITRETLMDYILTILEEPQEATTVLLTVRGMVDDDTFKIFESSLSKEYENESFLIEDIGKLLSFVNEYYIGKKAVNIFNKGSMSIKARRDRVESSKTFIEDTIAELEELTMGGSGAIDGITETIDLNNTGIQEVVEEMKAEVAGDKVYKAGWKLFNETFQGGLRPGEYYNISALSHNNKTGIFDSIITAILYYNKPIDLLPDKKPCLIVFKTEDALSKTFSFIFKLLKITEEGVSPDIKDYTVEEINKYLTENLLRHGWHVFFHNTNPSELTYRSVMKRVFDLEARGYQVMVAGIDYLTKMSTVGCNMGPHGTDKRDLVKRLMTFFKARKCLFLSPSQTNTNANALLEDGIEPYELPKVIAERGMYADSRQLHQEFDVSTQQQKFVKNGKAFLAVMREKHRTAPEVISEHMKYFILPFPLKGPIPMDLEKKETTGYRSYDQLLKGLNANKITMN